MAQYMASGSDRTPQNKLKVILSICNYLSKEVKEMPTAEAQESLSVALQCLEATYGISSESFTQSDVPDLWSAIIMTEDQIADQADSFKDRGNQHMILERYQEAVNSYTKAIKLNPKNAVYYCNRAAAFYRLEKFNESVDDCKMAIQLNPSYSKAYGRLGLGYLNMNMYKESIEAYEAALRLDPINGIYMQNLETAKARYREASSGTTRSFQSNMQEAYLNVLNNPRLMNSVHGILEDESVQSAVSGLRRMYDQTSSPPDMETLFSMSEQITRQLQATHPQFVETIHEHIMNLNQNRGPQFNQGPPDSQGPQQ